MMQREALNMDTLDGWCGEAVSTAQSLSIPQSCSRMCLVPVTTLCQGEQSPKSR